MIKIVIELPFEEDEDGDIDELIEDIKDALDDKDIIYTTISPEF